MMRKLAFTFAVALALPVPLTAQSSDMVTAQNPDGLVQLLEAADYSPELSTDSFGDPVIELEIAGYAASMLFYGCDEETHTNCDSVQLRAGFDRENPWTAEKAIEVSKRLRFVAVWLDDNGDPYVQWDIVTGAGIPADVFLTSLDRFAVTLDDAAKSIFAED